jgi:hypothetical protein
MLLSGSMITTAGLIDDQFLFGDEAGQIEPERGDILRRVFDAFFERHADAGLAEIARAAHQKFRSEERLATAGAATNRSGSPCPM